MSGGGLLGLIGLGYRGRGVVIGVDSIRRELQGRRCWCVVLAKDASARAHEKVARLAAARGIPVIEGPSAEAIGAQMGKPPVMAVGVRDQALAAGMIRLVSEGREGHGGISGQDASI